MSPVNGEPEPHQPECTQPHFIVGQDQHGCWLAIETHNLGGGLFRSREDALHFVDFETAHRPGACELATGPLHLRF